MDENQIRTCLRDFIAGFVRGQFADSENIFKSGAVNSLFVMQLVLFCETQFAMTLDNDDLTMANFSSIDALSRLVMHKLHGTSQETSRHAVG
jgi:methoxymalonate biosynthesis acyl carrier protein